MQEQEQKYSTKTQTTLKYLKLTLKSAQVENKVPHQNWTGQKNTCDKKKTLKSAVGYFSRLQIDKTKGKKKHHLIQEEMQTDADEKRKTKMTGPTSNLDIIEVEIEMVGYLENRPQPTKVFGTDRKRYTTKFTHLD